jgi:hypothetical protein
MLIGLDGDKRQFDGFRHWIDRSISVEYFYLKNLKELKNLRLLK